jgi:hypothetical protein
MAFVHQILIHTPVWVWALLAFLVWQGIKAMQPRTTPIWRALIVPTPKAGRDLVESVSAQDAGHLSPLERGEPR